MNNDKKQKVGFCNPPKHSQFKPGQSGNPKGRPRGIMDTDRLIDAIVSKKIVATVDGRPMRITKRQAMIIRAANEAVNGNFKHLQLLVPRLDRIDEKKAARAKATAQAMARTDREILDDYIKGDADE